MELESYAIASKKAKQVREVHLVRKGNNEVKYVPDVDEDLLKQLEVCLITLQRGKKGIQEACSCPRKEGST